MNNKNYGGNHMSLNKSATRRLSLLAGSSLVAATISAFAGVTLAPTSAYAYDECAVSATPTVPPTLSDGANGASDPTLNDPGGLTRNADRYSCAAGTYASGIAYTSNGDLTVSGSGALTITTNGIDLVGVGADTVTWTSAAINGGATLTDPGPVGALLEMTTASGAISATGAGTVTANRVGTTYGIRAVSGNAATSVAGGNITMSSTVGVNNNVAGGLAAVYAESNGGNVSLTYAGTVQSGQRGIVARTNGAGSAFVSVVNATAVGADGVAIDVTSGAGGFDVRWTGTLTAGSGVMVRGASTGAGLVTHARGVFSGAVDLSGVQGGATFNILDSGGTATRWLATGASTFGSGNDLLNLSGDGASTLASGASIGFGAGADVFDMNSSFTSGASVVDFGSGADQLLVRAGRTFTANGTTFNFGSGADTLNLLGRLSTANAVLNFGDDNDTLNISGTFATTGATLDFGAGEDTLNLSSSLTVSDLTFAGLEALNSSGVIYMGGQGGGTTNLAPGDILALPGVAFTGSGASRVVMDVNFAAGGQDDCSTALAADCLDFTGGSTDGSTLITVKDAGGNSTAGSSSRTVIVLGATEGGNFTLDANSDGYVLTDEGPALRKRLFDYYLLFDEDAGAYVFAAAPHAEAFQFATIAASAQDIWRTTTGTWFDRQADMRSTPGGIEPSRGLWARVGVGVADRDVEIPLDVVGVPFVNEVSYSQRTSHMVFGLDLLGAATQDSVWVIGASAGFVRSDTEYNAPSIEAIYAGFTGGLYASFLAGPLFFDATVNANVMDGEADVPALGFEGDVKLLQTVTSVGAQAQAGWRFAVGEAMFAEPLVSVSYVQTELDEIEVPGDAGTLTYDEGAKSLRAGAGLRVGLDSELMGQAASFSLTGRYWNELEGENGTVLTGNAPTLLVDDYSGSFSEVTGSLNLYSGDGGVSGFVNLGGRFADGYQSVDGSVGVRVRW